MIQKKISLFSFLLVLLAACQTDSANEDEMRTGYRPIYGGPEDASVAWLEPRTIKNPGKIYVYNSYLLVNESREGIHVFDNSDPSSPQALGFIQLLGNTDMAVKDGIIYADHMGNLVALNTAEFTAVQEKGRLPLANWDLGVPPPVSGVYFECVDPSKGLVVGWKKTDATNLKCYALY